MDFADSPVDVSGHARAAIETMARNGIPANPVNFSIWYAYHSGANAALRQDLDLLLANRAALTEATCEALFRQHFGAESGATAVPDAPHQDVAADELAALVRDVRRQTRRVVDRSRDLEQWLARTGRHLAREGARAEQALGAAMIDPLTGLANRAGFAAGLIREVTGLWRSRGCLALLIAEVDGFAEFKERCGQAVTDETLHAVGGAFRALARGKDTVARLEGHSFALIQRGATIEAAAALGEDLRRRLASSDLVNTETGARYGRLTVSVGVALYRLGEPTGDFVRRAEQALSQAKSEGGDRVSAGRGPVATGVGLTG